MATAADRIWTGPVTAQQARSRPRRRRSTPADIVPAGGGSAVPPTVRAIRCVAALDEPPPRFPAGADAVAVFKNRAKLFLEQADAHRELSSNLAYDNA